MAKKSTPSAPLSYAVATTLDRPTIPPGLGEQGQRLWSAVMSEYAIDDSGGRELLRQTAMAVDRLERLRRIINTDGELVEQADGPPKEHPLLRAEHMARSYVAQTLTRLGLTTEPIKGMGRPSGKSGAI
jgi:hypothetical protein